MPTVEYTCIHEELIQDHSIKLQELDTKAGYKEQAIMELKAELKDMNAKIDAINNNVNKLILNSETNDSQIQKRVETIETKLELYEKFFRDMKDDENKRKDDENKRDNLQLTLYGLIVAVLALLANTIFHFI